MIDMLEFGEKSTWIDLIEGLVMPLIHHKGNALVSIEIIENKIAEKLSKDDLAFIKEALKLKGIKVTPFIDTDSTTEKDRLEFTKIKQEVE